MLRISPIVSGDEACRCSLMKSRIMRRAARRMRGATCRSGAGCERDSVAVSAVVDNRLEADAQTRELDAALEQSTWRLFRRSGDMLRALTTTASTDAALTSTPSAE